MTILGENYDERYGLDEYDVYDPFEGEETDPEEEYAREYQENLEEERTYCDLFNNPWA